MRDFARAQGRLRGLPLPARVTYSIFIAFTLLGLGLSAWLTADMLAPNLSRFDEYYAGEPAAARSDAADTAALGEPAPGPSLELPDELARPAAAEPIALRKLLEVTHFHLFSMPIYLMVLSHLFMLSSWGSRSKLGWIAASSLAVAAHLAAPWIAREGGAFARAFYALSGGLLGATFALMSVVALLDMWLPAKRRDEARETQA
jgi:hypothetical protein